MLQAFDVLAGDTDLHFAHGASVLALCQLDGLGNGVDRLLDIRDDTTQYAFTGDLTKTQDLQLAVLISLSDDGTHLGGTDVDSDDDFVLDVQILFFHCVPFY
jgi:hypothetical protein